jgi:shikimate kinase
MSSPVTKIFLTGFMGVGKTTVGKLLAKERGVPFVDTDHWIEKRAGKTVAEIFAAEGEARFRELEREALAELARDKTARVIGLGGGAILDPANQKILLEHGTLVWLRANPETILERVEREPGQRPLLEGLSRDEKLGRIIKMLQARQQAYGVATLRVLTDGKNPSDVVAEVIGLLE